MKCLNWCNQLLEVFINSFFFKFYLILFVWKNGNQQNWTKEKSKNLRRRKVDKRKHKIGVLGIENDGKKVLKKV